MKGNSELKKYAKELSLNIFRIGCNKDNFLILNMIINKPTSTGEIMDKLHLSSMPTNRRLNHLAEVGLIKREHGKSKIVQTKITSVFIKLINNIQNIIEKEIEIKQKVEFR